MLSWNSATNVGKEVNVGVRLGRLMENGNGSGYGEPGTDKNGFRFLTHTGEYEEEEYPISSD
jgi:hypothetical protein